MDGANVVETSASAQQFELRCAIRTDVGLRRRENQDSYSYITGALGSLYIVADGMGGAQGGATASALAANVVARSVFKATALTPQTLEDAIIRANKFIHQKSLVDPELHGMGTTFVALAVTGPQVFFAHVGDSRLYRTRDGELTQLTKDHTYVQELVDSGAITAKDADHHPISHMLTRSLGPGHDVKVETHVSPDALKAGEKFLLCCDGLYNHVRDEEIGELLRTMSPDSAVEALLRLALERGGTDNVTVLAIEVLAAEAGAPALVESAKFSRELNVEAEEKLLHEQLENYETQRQKQYMQSLADEREAEVASADRSRNDKAFVEAETLKANPIGKKRGRKGTDRLSQVSAEGFEPTGEIDDDLSSPFVQSRGGDSSDSGNGVRFPLIQFFNSFDPTFLKMLGGVAIGLGSTLIVWTTFLKKDVYWVPAGTEESRGAMKDASQRLDALEKEMGTMRGGDTWRVEGPTLADAFGPKPTGPSTSTDSSSAALLASSAPGVATTMATTATTAVPTSTVPTSTVPTTAVPTTAVPGNVSPLAAVDPALNASSISAPTTQSTAAAAATPTPFGSQTGPDTVSASSVATEIIGSQQSIPSEISPAISIQPSGRDVPVEQALEELRKKYGDLAVDGNTPLPDKAPALSPDEMQRIRDHKSSLRENLRDLDLTLRRLKLETPDQVAAYSKELDTRLEGLRKDLVKKREELDAGIREHEMWLVRQRSVAERDPLESADELSSVSKDVKTNRQGYQKMTSEYLDVVYRFQQNQTDKKLRELMASLGAQLQGKRAELEAALQTTVLTNVQTALEKLADTRVGLAVAEADKDRLIREIGALKDYSSKPNDAEADDISKLERRHALVTQQYQVLSKFLNDDAERLVARERAMSLLQGQKR